jgi:hypothetical protein
MYKSFLLLFFKKAVLSSLYAVPCPETAHRKRLPRMKQHHGLGQNHASLVPNTAFPRVENWATPDALADKLWADPEGRAILAKLTWAAARLPDVVVGQRKTFTAFSRNFQFAALRPATRGALPGLALPPDADPALQAAKRESRSERLKSCVPVTAAADVDARIARLLQAAWEKS